MPCNLASWTMLHVERRSTSDRRRARTGSCNRYQTAARLQCKPSCASQRPNATALFNTQKRVLRPWRGSVPANARVAAAASLRMADRPRLGSQDKSGTSFGNGASAGGRGFFELQGQEYTQKLSVEMSMAEVERVQRRARQGSIRLELTPAKNGCCYIAPNTHLVTAIFCA